MSRTIFILLLTVAGALADDDWRSRLTPLKPEGFPPLRPVTLHYRMGWSGISAGEASIVYTHPKRDVLELEASGGTRGMARSLWKMDAKHTALAHESTLRPISVKDTETYDEYSVETKLQFTDSSVSWLRKRSTDDIAPKLRTFRLPGVLDLHSTLLFIRDHPMKTGDSMTFVVYPFSAPYLATVTAQGREKLSVKAGKYEAVKVDLKLWEIDRKTMKLKPHKKFKRATAWLSDDKDRLPLKIESDIFIGSVWAELEEVKPAK